jgi:uncharacterized tellurite resistance protein B-like protein
VSRDDVDYDYLNARIGALLAEKLGEAHELLHEAGLAALMTSLMLRAARSDGSISQEETQEILVTLQEVFSITGARALELVNSVASQLASDSDLMTVFAGLQFDLNDSDKKMVLLLLLRIIAADGKQDSKEMTIFTDTVKALDISPEVVHRVFDRYFEETMVNDEL